ncbi:hypothetical protein M8C21_020514, partial [Ambrosia artemisiifolia]
MCGNVRIPYPFGISANCSVNQWYIVDCKSSTPYLRALNHPQVLGMSLENETITIRTPKISNCQKIVGNSTETVSFDLGRSPFFFSEDHNKFVFEGCGTATLMVNGSVVTACSTACRGVILRDGNNCFGIGCCQAKISNLLNSYSIHVTGLEEEDGGCGSAFLVDEMSYDEGRFNVKNSSFIPVTLFWTLTDSDQVTCCGDQPPEENTIDMFNGTSTTVDTRRCYMLSSITKGNPYLLDGCVESEHDEEDPSGECKSCKDSGGYCGSDAIYNLDGSVFDHTITCYHYNRPSLGVILGICLFLI